MSIQTTRTDSHRSDAAASRHGPGRHRAGVGLSADRHRGNLAGTGPVYGLQCQLPNTEFGSIHETAPVGGTRYCSLRDCSCYSLPILAESRRSVHGFHATSSGRSVDCWRQGIWCQANPHAWPLPTQRICQACSYGLCGRLGSGASGQGDRHEGWLAAIYDHHGSGGRSDRAGKELQCHDHRADHRPGDFLCRRWQRQTSASYRGGRRTYADSRHVAIQVRR